MKRHEWIQGEDNIDELYKCKNLGVLKTYIGSFSSDIDDNIEKTHNKAGMIYFPLIFLDILDRRKVSPLTSQSIPTGYISRAFPGD